MSGGVMPIPSNAPSYATAIAKATAMMTAGGLGLGGITGDKATAPRPPSKKKQDEIYLAARQEHRFESYAPERPGNSAKWFVDARGYLWALSELIESAKDHVYILDWWLSPELYMRRPPEQYQDFRLDRLLQRKAAQGVKIYVAIYQEIEAVSPLDSQYTQQALEKLHPNISVMRHPDHSIFSAESTFYWSHHEKMVVVDGATATLGGLDLCFGRWDTHNHSMADAHPSKLNRTLFPGQDYNNVRVLEFQNMDEFTLNKLSNLEVGRMPWHDCSLMVSGPSVVDILQHFVERWNFIKRQKYADDPRYPVLTLPTSTESVLQTKEAHAKEASAKETKAKATSQKPPPESSVSSKGGSSKGHSVRKDLEQKGKQVISRLSGFVKRHSRESTKTPESEPSGSHTRTATATGTGKSTSRGNLSEKLGSSCTIQFLRSVSEWSHDVPTETSIQNAYISLIQEAKYFIYIENQFFISATATGGAVKNQIAAALTERILKAAKADEKFKVIVTFPEAPGNAGVIKDTETLQIILAAQWRTINRGGASIMERIRAAGYDPANYIQFYHLRSYDRINGPQSVIQRIAAKTGVSYEDTQAALERIWLGDTDSKSTGGEKTKQVVFKKPHEAVPSKAGMHMSGSDAGVAVGLPSLGRARKDPETVTADIPGTVQAAQATIAKFEAGSIDADRAVKDSVAGHAYTLNTGPLKDEKWTGTDDELKQAFVSEITYIHSKVMIVDDLKVIMGSPNLNDRSMRGDGDSEIAVLIEDTEMIDSNMNGQAYQASRFAATFRRALFKEHLGLMESDPHDPNKVTEVTTCMRTLPTAAKDTSQTPGDLSVEDPLSDAFQNLWNETAKKNTETFSDIFKTVPSNLVRSWKDYDAYVPKVIPGHVAPTDLTAAQVAEKLDGVRGHLVQGAVDFLDEEEGLYTGIFWSTWNFLLPLWV